MFYKDTNSYSVIIYGSPSHSIFGLKLLEKPLLIRVPEVVRIRMTSRLLPVFEYEWVELLFPSPCGRIVGHVGDSIVAFRCKRSILFLAFRLIILNWVFHALKSALPATIIVHLRQYLGHVARGFAFHQGISILLYISDIVIQLFFWAITAGSTHFILFFMNYKKWYLYFKKILI